MDGWECQDKCGHRIEAFREEDTVAIRVTSDDRRGGLAIYLSPYTVREFADELIDLASEIARSLAPED